MMNTSPMTSPRRFPNLSAMMWCWWFGLWMLCGNIPLLAVASKPKHEEESPSELRKVIVGFKSDEEKSNFVAQTIVSRQQHQLQRSGSNMLDIKQPKAYHRVKAVALEVTSEEYENLIASGNYEYIQDDIDVYKLQSNDNFGPYPNEIERVPYGILDVLQVDSEEELFTDERIPLPPSLTNDSTTDDCFRVCVIDSGLLVGHPDIPFILPPDGGPLDGIPTTSAGPQSFRLTGSQFGLPDGQFWYNPEALGGDSHGTHVAGTIFAKGDNSEGVVGVIHNPQGMCLSIARIFADGESRTSLSAIYEAVEYCADVGSRVINMSLGFTGDPDPAGNELYDQLFNEGILVVAAAGNDGTTGKSYPASHKSVISVAAIDENFQVANFSQYNDEIDLAAPGVDVLSTGGGVLQIFDRDDPNRTAIDLGFMSFSPLIEEDSPFLDAVIPIVDCGLGGEICTNVSNKACLIERGTFFFWEKALSCQNGGGIMAFIYNNEDGSFGGDLTEAASQNIKIPVLSVPRDQGLMLLRGSGFITVRMLEHGYVRLSGTSMASPHVAGVAARIWAARPRCSIEQIEEALFTTALDLGDSNRDDRYGHGLVQAVSAYEYLLTLFEPCGLVEMPSSAPSTMPSLSPSATPSVQPSETPSATPSLRPSSTPSLAPTTSQSPSSVPSFEPTIEPSFEPTIAPSSLPTTIEQSQQSAAPSGRFTSLLSRAVGMIVMCLYLL